MANKDNKNNDHNLSRDVNAAELKLAQTIEESYAARRIYWPAYTWPVQTSYSSFIAKNEAGLSIRLPKINKDALTNYISDLAGTPYTRHGFSDIIQSIWATQNTTIASVAM